MLVVLVFAITVILCAMHKVYIVDLVKKEVSDFRTYDFEEYRRKKFNLRLQNIAIYAAIVFVGVSMVLSMYMILFNYI
jgi:hypothetical protein